jgi:hypothetical protein
MGLNPSLEGLLSLERKVDQELHEPLQYLHDFRRDFGNTAPDHCKGHIGRAHQIVLRTDSVTFRLPRTRSRAAGCDRRANRLIGIREQVGRP